MPSARLPCSVIFCRLLVSSRRDVLDVGALVLGQRSRSRGGGFLQFRQQIDREVGEVVDEVQRVLDLVRDAGGELAERGHFLGLDQIGLGDFELAEGGLDRARGFLGRVTGGGDLGLGAFAFGDVGVDDDEAAARRPDCRRISMTRPFGRVRSMT